MKNSAAGVIMKCAAVQITRDDELPNFICQSCSTQLEKIHQFLMQIEDSDRTLRRYFQQLYASDKPIKAECSAQPSKDIIIPNTKNDISKCDSLEPANFNQEHKNHEEMYIKSEIIDEPMDANLFLPTECADDAEDTLANVDGNKFSCEDPNIETGVAKVTEDTIVNYCKDKEQANYIMEEIYLKSEINDEKMDDNLFLPTECADSASSNVDSNKFNCKDSKIDIGDTKENEETIVSWKEKEQTNYVLANKIREIQSLKSEIDDEQNSTDSINASFNGDGSGISCEDINLNRHKRTHTREKPYQCDVCNKGFNNKSNFNRHKSIHIGDKRFICNVCNKCFTQSSSLNIHKLKHTGEKPFKCNECDKCFSRSTYLNTHKHKHTDEKPYKCNLCDKGYSQLAHLNRHKLKHTGEKPYKCSVCDKCYSQLPHLNRHKFKHTGEKPYKCNVCDKCFTQSSDLNRHKFKHTGEKP